MKRLSRSIRAPASVPACAVLLLVAAFLLPEILGSVAEAYAQAPVAPSQVPGPGQTLVKMLPMFLVVFMIFHFMVIKPQQQKVKSQEELLGSLKKGDGVVTSGGLFGKVSAIEEEHVLLEIAPNVKVKVERTSIARRDTKPPAKAA